MSARPIPLGEFVLGERRPHVLDGGQAQFVEDEAQAGRIDCGAHAAAPR
jgi:hypothetical protein